MRALTRVVGGLSRRWNRPQWLAAVDTNALLAQREAVGMSAVLAASLRGDGIYVDIGANRGQVLREATRIAPGARHVAFEPIPGLARELALAFPAVDCRQKALGARAETAEFCHFRRLDGWSGLRRSPDISDQQGDPEFISVEVSTLDIELAGMAPSVVKIDVEGAELAVLEGARRLLSEVRPIVIFEHFSGAAGAYGVSLGAPWDLLVELDYEIFTVTGEGPFPRAEFVRGAGVVNWLATPRGVASRPASTS